MKNIFLYIAIIAVVSTATSCSDDFLTIRPVGVVDEEILLNKEGIESVVTGMYQTLLTKGGEFRQPAQKFLANPIWGDMLGGDINKGSSVTDQPNWTNIESFSITADNDFILGKWSSCYNGVFRANLVLDMISKIENELSEIEGESKSYYAETEAEAMFFRGFWHFEAVKVFGAAIPYVDLAGYRSSANPIIGNHEDGSYVYIWDSIMSDLQFAYENLPDTWSSDNGRINKWAALAMLVKVQVYYSSPYDGTNGTGDMWSNVKTNIETLMSNGVDNKGTRYRLADTYQELFIAGQSDWTGESVLDIQQAIFGTETTINQTNSNVWTGLMGALGVSAYGFQNISTDLAHSYYVDANGLPMLDRGYENAYPNEPMSEIIDNNIITRLEQYTDPRIDVNIGRFHVPYYDWGTFTELDGVIRDVSNNGLYFQKKCNFQKSDVGTYTVPNQLGTAKNTHLIRWADVLLWYAEALIEDDANRDLASAMNYINEVRTRAANFYLPADANGTNYLMEDMTGNGNDASNAAANYRIGLWQVSNFGTVEDARKALRAERRAELAVEGHLWFDLCRWGIVVQEVNNYVNYEQNFLNKFTNKVYGNWYRMPIPDLEILTMEGALKQNSNWQ